MPEIRQITTYEVDPSTGELLPVNEFTQYRKSVLGVDYIVMYKSAIEMLLQKKASYTVLKVYLKLANMQSFDSVILTTNANIYKSLGITPNAFYKAIDWLKDNEFVKQAERNGHSGYIINPKVAACGTSALNRRRVLWSSKPVNGKIVDNPPPPKVTVNDPNSSI